MIQTKTLEVYLIDRDIYRVRRGLEEKWQEVHLGFIEDVWKTRKLRMGKLATMNRLLWDRGWHGGNRTKTTCPAGATEEEWISCGDCGQPDSQNHWIRECKADHIKAVRLVTKSKVHEFLGKIQLIKGKKSIRSEIHSACTELVDAAYYGDGGEQLWVGLIPGHIMNPISLRLSQDACPTGKMRIPNWWRTNITRLLQILAGGVQLAWQAKETARTDRLRGSERSQGKTNRASSRRSRNQDIRVLY